MLLKHSVGRGGEGESSEEAGKGSGKPLEGLRRSAQTYILKRWHIK